MDQQTTAGAPAAGSAAMVSGEMAPGGARLLRSFFGAWRALTLRGARDRTFLSSLAELQQAVAALWAEGSPAQLVRYGRSLMAGPEAVDPHSLLRLQAEALSKEFAARGLGGISFREPWDEAAVVRFLQLLQGWQRGAAGEDSEAALLKHSKQIKQEQLREEEIACVVIEDAIHGDEAEQEASAWDSLPRLGEPRRRAKQTFFRALRSARWHLRSMAGSSQVQTRQARVVVHEIVDRLIEDESSILSMTALNDFDEYTFHHCVNVCILASALGQRLGLGKREVSELGVAAFFHDLGKLSIPEPVLNKPGKFDPEEWRIMQSHPLEGVRALLRSEKVNELTLKIMLVALEHHMRVDMTGYPRMGDAWEIGMLSRIVTIADCYDAMTTKRVYHERAMHPHDVLQHMIGLSGQNFDAALLRLFVGMVGLYPVGSLVRLSSGELAVAVASRDLRPSTPLVRLVRDAGGQVIDTHDLQLVDLAEEQDRGDGGGRRIVAPEDARESGVDLAGYLT